MKNLQFAFILVFITWLNCKASHEVILEVFQPNMTENGIVESSTSYLRIGNYMADAQLLLTTEKNLIEVKGKIENRNIANIFNFKVKILGDPIQSDTISLQLTIPEKIEVPHPFDELSIEEVVVSTINCIIKNSKFHFYVDLKIIGDKSFSKHEKVYYTGKIKYTIQVKAFPISEYDDAISFFNSLKDIGHIVFLEFTTVKKEEFIRVKVGYFETKREAYLTAELLKLIKDIEYFVTFCDLKTQYISHKEKIEALGTASGIWAMRNTNFIELYDFTKNEKISTEIYQYSFYNNKLHIYNPQGAQIDEILISSQLASLKSN
jgi:hypothetical protein